MTLNSHVLLFFTDKMVAAIVQSYRTETAEFYWHACKVKLLKLFARVVNEPVGSFYCYFMTHATCYPPRPASPTLTR